MASYNQIEKAVAGLFQDIRFTHEPRGLYDPLRYMIEIGGKRLRPALCLTAYSLYKEGFSEEVLQCAAALEVFHSFTLIHDDIMDRSPMRRGKSTVWTKWGEDTAILSGDVMCIDAYRRLASAPADVLPQVLDLFSTTAAQVCEGQQYDMDFESVDSVPMQDYMNMIGLKTAVLLACSAKMGALIGGASKEACAALYDFGYQLGIAFQITDDYLDTFGNEKVFGKKIGGDIVNNKKTWLLVECLRRAAGEQKQQLEKLLQLGEDRRQEKVEAVRGLYVELGVREAAADAILVYHKKAMDALAASGFDPARTRVLAQFAEELIHREK